MNKLHVIFTDIYAWHLLTIK